MFYLVFIFVGDDEWCDRSNTQQGNNCSAQPKNNVYRKLLCGNATRLMRRGKKCSRMSIISALLTHMCVTENDNRFTRYITYYVCFTFQIHMFWGEHCATLDILWYYCCYNCLKAMGNFLQLKILQQEQGGPHESRINHEK